MSPAPRETQYSKQAWALLRVPKSGQFRVSPEQEHTACAGCVGMKTTRVAVGRDVDVIVGSGVFVGNKVSVGRGVPVAVPVGSAAAVSV